MNIFYLDHDPIRCAQLHCDAHVIKMVTEYAQLLSSAMWVYEPVEALALYKRGQIMNAPPHVTGKKVHAHFNHRCMVWTRASRQNFDWLKAMALELGKEYHRRYGWRKDRQHSALMNCIVHLNSSNNFPDHEFTPPPQSMPDEYKGLDTVWAYRRLYKYEKIRFARYTNRSVPTWLRSEYLKRWYLNHELPMYKSAQPMCFDLPEDFHA